MTNKEKFLQGYRFGFGDGSELMVYCGPGTSKHPFGNIKTAGGNHIIGICETHSINDNGFFVWTFWMKKHISKEVLFSELQFFEPCKP